jgi:hypothetical protein
MVVPEWQSPRHAGKIHEGLAIRGRQALALIVSTLTMLIHLYRRKRHPICLFVDRLSALNKPIQVEPIKQDSPH